MNTHSSIPAPVAVPAAAPQPFRVLVIPGDGIGREVVPAALQVLQASGLPIALTAAEAGWGCFERYGTSLPEETLAQARAADAILFGAVASPSHPVPGYRSPIVALRRALDLYANIRPVTSIDEGRKTEDESSSSSVPRHPSSVNLVVVRENTEGLYSGRERIEDDGATAIAERVITRRASERIVRAAFELARSRGTTKDERRTMNSAPPSSLIGHRSSFPMVTIVHKANVLRETCGLFRAVAFEVAAEYPDIATDELLVDNAALQLVQRPERFDVIVTTNMFGDILSDVASYWGGGLGLAVSANLGDRQALFEPVHGSAPDIAGQGIANPLAAIGCAALLLEHLANCRLQVADCRLPDVAAAMNDSEQTLTYQQSMRDECQLWAARIRSAIKATLANGPKTPDLGGSATTEVVTAAILASMTHQA